MKTKLYLLFFFVFPLFMSACRGDDPIPDPPVDGKRTVLVYMAADNSINPLASFTDGDLEELKAGMASIDNTSDMHLLVYIDTGFPRLIEIENKGGTVVETIVKEYEDRKTRSHTDGFQRNNAKCLDEKGISRFVPHSSI